MDDETHFSLLTDDDTIGFMPLSSPQTRSKANSIVKKASQIERNILLPGLKQSQGPSLSPDLNARNSVADVLQQKVPIVLPTHSPSNAGLQIDPALKGVVLTKRGTIQASTPHGSPIYSPFIQTFRKEDLAHMKRKSAAAGRNIISSASDGMLLRHSSINSPQTTSLQRVTNSLLPESKTAARAFGRGPDSGAIRRLTNNFQDEEAKFTSTVLLCEARFARAMVATGPLPVPNSPRTLATVQMLAEVISVCGRYDGLLLVIAKELLRSTYQEFDLVWDSFQKFLHDSEQKDEASCSSDLLLHCGNPFFERVAVLEGQLEKVTLENKGNALVQMRMKKQLSSAKVAINTRLDKWLRVVQLLVFYSWQSFRLHQKIIRDKFKRVRLRIWFSSWRNTIWRNKGMNLEMELSYARHKNKTDQTAISASSLEMDKRFAVYQEIYPGGADPNLMRSMGQNDERSLPPAAQQALLHYRREVLSAIAKGILPPDALADQYKESGALVICQLAEGKFHNMLEQQTQHLERVRSESSTLLNRIVNLSQSELPLHTAALQSLVETINEIVQDIRQGHKTFFKRGPLQDVETQTDAVDIVDTFEDVEASSDGKDQSARRTPTIVGGPLEKSKYVIESLINELYVRKIYADALDDKAFEERESLRSFLESYYMSKHANPSVAEQHLQGVDITIKKYEKKSARIALFGKLCGFSKPDEFTPTAADLILAVITDCFDCDIRNIRISLAEGCGFTFVPYRKLCDVFKQYIAELPEKTQPSGKSKKKAKEDSFMLHPEDSNGQCFLKKGAREELFQALKASAKMGQYSKSRKGVSYRERHKWKDDALVVDLDRALQLLYDAWNTQRQSTKAKLIEEIKRYAEDSGQKLGYGPFNLLMNFLMPGALSVGNLRRMFTGVATASRDPAEKGVAYIRPYEFNNLAELILQKSNVVQRDDKRLERLLKAKMAMAAAALLHSEGSVKQHASHTSEELSKATSDHKAPGHTMREATRCVITIQRLIRGWRIRRREAAKAVILRSSKLMQKRLKSNAVRR